MKIHAIVFAALLVLASCGSNSADGNYNRAADDDLIEEQVDTGTKTAIDSVAQATDEGRILYPLPDTLLKLLDKWQPQARVATLTDQAMANRRLQVDNPLYISGNFNGNSAPDYAVQVLQNDSIHILAFLDYTSQEREMRVATYPAQQLKEEWYSTYQLRLAPQDSVVTDNRSQKQVPLPTDGISVLEENRTTLYVLQNGRFIPFDAKE